MYDDDFSTVTAPTNVDAIKRWEGLFKQQPSATVFLNQFPHCEDTFDTNQNPKLNIMDLMSEGSTITPVESQLTTTIPRIDGRSKNKPGLVNKKRKSWEHVDSVVGIQLATKSDSVTVSKKKKRKSDEITISEGATDYVSEGRQITATGVAQSAPSLQLDASKDLMRFMNRAKPKNNNKPYMLDATKSTKRTSSKQRISTRVRKQAKVRAALVALHDLAEDIHKHDKHKLGQTTECFLTHHAKVSMLDGEQINDLHPLAFAAGGLGPNPNILNHGEAMAAVDKESFEDSMDEEIFKVLFVNSCHGFSIV